MLITETTFVDHYDFRVYIFDPLFASHEVESGDYQSKYDRIAEMEAFSKVLEFVGKYAWAVCVTILFVLFIPDDAAKQIGISELRSVYKGPLWIVLVLTFVLALGSAFQYIDRRLIEGWLKERREARKRAEKEQQNLLRRKESERCAVEAVVLRLSSLNSDEQMWIKYCLFHNVQTLSAERGNRTAQSLRYKGIVEEGSGYLLDLPFHIPDKVWGYLLDHKNDFLSDAELGDPQFLIILDQFRKSLWPIY